MDSVEISTLVRQLFQVLAFFAAMILPWKFASKQAETDKTLSLGGALWTSFAYAGTL